jgi:hypothetical protein
VTGVQTCALPISNLVAEFLRDFEQARPHRGLRFSTAGSVNNGSRLTGMRLLMAAIQRHGRYPVVEDKLT